MRTALKIVLVLVAGIVLGLGATWFGVIKGAMPGAVSDGPWKTSLATGSREGDIMLRARVAVHGLLALSRQEAIYYTAATDGDGAALSGACIYRLEGHDPAARWWSITAYGADDFLIPNPAGRYSQSRHSVARGPDGRFVVTVGKAKQSGDWIPVADGPFTLTLRLYNPDPSVADDPAHAALPTLTKESCA
jgi:hypothetical protein